MGEAKRSKALDPTFGRIPKQGRGLVVSPPLIRRTTTSNFPVIRRMRAKPSRFTKGSGRFLGAALRFGRPSRHQTRWNDRP
jgi:hypothetical protein